MRGVIHLITAQGETMFSFGIEYSQNVYKSEESSGFYCFRRISMFSEEYAEQI